MSRSLIGMALLTALSVLFLLRQREQQRKAASRAAQLESRGYMPLTIDDAEPDLVTKGADTISRAYGGVSLALLVFVLAAVGFLADIEPLVKWILVGTLSLMAGIILIWSLSGRGKGSVPHVVEKRSLHLLVSLTDQAAPSAS